MMELEKVKSALTPVVLEIIELIGYPAAQMLIAKLGGISFPVSGGVRLSDSFRRGYLVEAIGQEAAGTLEKRFGGEILYIPRCDRALRLWRNNTFVLEYQALINGGMSGRRALLELCPRYGITDRLAQRILAHHEHDAAQGQQLGLL